MNPSGIALPPEPFDSRRADEAMGFEGGIMAPWGPAAGGPRAMRSRPPLGDPGEVKRTDEELSHKSGEEEEEEEEELTGALLRRVRVLNEQSRGLQWHDARQTDIRAQRDEASALLGERLRRDLAAHPSMVHPSSPPSVERALNRGTPPSLTSIPSPTDAEWKQDSDEFPVNRPAPAVAGGSPFNVSASPIAHARSPPTPVMHTPSQGDSSGTVSVPAASPEFPFGTSQVAGDNRRARRPVHVPISERVAFEASRDFPGVNTRSRGTRLFNESQTSPELYARGLVSLLSAAQREEEEAMAASEEDPLS